MAAAWAVLSGALLWVLQATGVLLLILFVLLLILLFVPVFVALTYDDSLAKGETLSVTAGMFCIRVHLYPRIYIIWDRYANETPEHAAMRKERKAIKQAEKKAKKEAERGAKEVDKETKKAVAKGGKATFDSIVFKVRMAGVVAKLILGALRIQKIRIRLPVRKKDPAQTAIQYGKTSAWLYGGLAILNNFLYLDFDEVRVYPVFEENLEKNAYFSCQISAQLFILVIVLYQLFQILNAETNLVQLLGRKKTHRKSSQTK